MDYLRSFYPESRFGGFTDIDGTIAFYSRVNALLDPDSMVLDVGCGRGEYDEDPVPFRRELRILRGKVARVVGIDVDRAAGRNPFLDEFRLLEGGAWPVDDDSVDLVLCDWVLEHVRDPEAFFLEARRVLREGGHMCIRTANRWSYPALAATLVPDRHHARVLRTAQERKKPEDVFPTVYACNSLRKVRRRMEACGLECVVYGYEAEPRYLSFSRVAYWLGVLHQRFAPGWLKPAIFAFGVLR